MKKVIHYFLVLTFALLSLLHFYWAVGGRWGFKSALPANENGNIILNPSTFDSFFAGFILSFFSIFYFSLFDKKNRFVNIIKFFIPLIFILRTIGDFKFVGFFKTITTTNFAYLDTVFYTPLCLLISFSGFYLIFKKNS